MSTPSPSKTVLITGASQGIGHVIATSLLQAPEQHNVMLVARTEAPLKMLNEQYPQRVEYFVADLADLSTGPKVVSHALQTFSKIDTLIINHGTLHPVARLAATQTLDWVSTFNTNFFSAISLIIPLLPTLRTVHGSIILLTSGASISPYSTWGPYGNTKAALNHLALQLSVEEKDITTIAMRPGSVETPMMREVRETIGGMDEKDQRKFIQGRKEGKILDPGVVGGVIGRVGAGVAGEGWGLGLSGRYLSWDDEVLNEFRESGRV